MYSNPITRLHPTAFIVLIDRSGSMKEKIVFAGAEMTKARAVTLVANSFIDELLYRARREGGVRDYYNIAVLGYSGDGVDSLISPDGEFTSPSRLAAMRVHREKITRERVLPSGRSVMAVTEHNVWIREKAAGITPMCGAMRDALALVERWCRQKQNAASYPPTIINITDGEASDGDADTIRATAERIRRTGTSDGKTLFMNIHLAREGSAGGGYTEGAGSVGGVGGGSAGSAGGAGVGGTGVSGDAEKSKASGGEPVLFPSSPDMLPDSRYARLLYDISSEMPENYNDIIASQRTGAIPPFRAVAFNSHIGDVAAMINIGSINSVML
jgi:hypothetical protein